MARGNREQLLQPRAMTGWAFRLLVPANEQLEFVVTFSAGVFVEGHFFFLASGGRQPPGQSYYKTKYPQEPLTKHHGSHDDNEYHQPAADEHESVLPPCYCGCDSRIVVASLGRRLIWVRRHAQDSTAPDGGPEEKLRGQSEPLASPLILTTIPKRRLLSVLWTQ